MSDLSGAGPSGAAVTMDDLPAWLRAVWESTSDAIAVSDHDGVVLAANPAYLELYGFDHAEVVGQSFAIIFPEEHRAWAVEQHRRVFADPGSPGLHEARIHRKDGTERAVEARADFVEENGVRTALISTIRDVTERVAAVEALRASEERFRTLVDNLPDFAIFLLAPDRTITEWSAGAERVKGYVASEVLGRRVEMFSPPEDVAAGTVDREFRQAEETGRAEREGWRVRKSGERFWANEIVTAVRDADGRLTGFSKICRDLSQRQGAEQALRVSEDRSRTLTDSIDQGFCVIDVMFDESGAPVDYVFVEANLAFTRNTGLVDVIGRGARELVPGHESYWFEIYGRVATTGVSERFESEAAGLGRWYSVYAFPIGSQAEHRLAVLFEDITRRKLAEQELVRGRTMAERAVTARDRFLSIGAHELRTPITGIKGTASLLARSIKRGTLTPERLDRYVASLLQATGRLESMVTELFDIARLHASESGELARRPVQVDLERLVVETIGQHWRGLRGSRIVTVLETGPPVLAEPTEIRQVLVNLVENAVKYSPGGEPVEVTLAFAGGGATVTVRDQGIGLPAGALASIFQPFSRAANAEASSIPGLGLGLYICHEIAERHGGRLWAESPGEGLGTTVSLWLPVDGPAG